MTRNQAKGRTQACGATEARSRLRQARRFIEVAELAGDESAPDPDFTSAAAALTVLAGIAAADAACCKALGMRSRSDNHPMQKACCVRSSLAVARPPWHCAS